MSISNNKQKGITVVELMVAIALSLLLVLGVMQLFIASKATYASNKGLSEVQENGRFAIQILSRDIRNAGYSGQCLTTPVNHINNSATSLWAANDAPIQGWDSSKPAFIGKAIATGSDVVFFQFAEGAGDVEGSNANSASDATITLDSGSSPVGAGTVTLISDGLACDLFSNDTGDSNAVVRAGNINWSHDYTGEFEVLSFKSVAYYIADDDGLPTLHRSYIDQGMSEQVVEPLVPGINSMSIEYGIANDGVVSDYVAAGSVTDWRNVASVKVRLDVVSGLGVAREFSTTIALRNLLP